MRHAELESSELMRDHAPIGSHGAKQSAPTTIRESHERSTDRAIRR